MSSRRFEYRVTGRTVDEIAEKAYAELDRITDSTELGWEMDWDAVAIQDRSGDVLTYEAVVVAEFML